MSSNIYKCPTCNKNVTKTQRSIDCSYCEKYYHISCGKISKEQHDILVKNKIFKYICEHCSRIPKYCNIQEELRDGFSSLLTTLEQKLEEKFIDSKRELDEQLKSGLKLLEDKINELPSQGAVANSSDVEQMKSDLRNCFDVVNVVDNAANRRISDLQMQNNILQRRLNRSNIIIMGLPKRIKDLRKPIVKICSLCNIRVSYTDIQHCTYFAGGKKVLVKFNSVQIRDEIMISYHKKRNVKLKDVIGGTAQSDVFLNDHLTDSAKRLIAVCRKLKDKNKVTKYTFKNYDIPKVRVILPTNDEKTLTYEQCAELLDGDGVLNDCSFSSVIASGYVSNV